MPPIWGHFVPFAGSLHGKNLLYLCHKAWMYFPGRDTSHRWGPRTPGRSDSQGTSHLPRPGRARPDRRRQLAGEQVLSSPWCQTAVTTNSLAGLYYQPPQSYQDNISVLITIHGV